MKKYNPKKHNRRSIRLEGYDYAQAGLYFITICVQNREHLFGEIVDGEMILNEYGKIAFSEWENTPEVRENFLIHEFVIMPNHIHGIIEIIIKKGEDREVGEFRSPSHTVGSMVRGFKIATIKRIKDLINNNGEELQFAPTDDTVSTEIIKSLDFKIWQRNYYEHIIRNEKAYNNISNYIINNPKKWDEDKFYESR